MTPEQDASEVFDSFHAEGERKYMNGVREHGGGLWTAGGAWFAGEIANELIDGVVYLHHLRKRLEAMKSLAAMMRAEEISLSQAAVLLDNLVSDRPPCSVPHQSRD